MFFTLSKCGLCCPKVGPFVKRKCEHINSRGLLNYQKTTGASCRCNVTLTWTNPRVYFRELKVSLSVSQPRWRSLAWERNGRGRKHSCQGAPLLHIYPHREHELNHSLDHVTTLRMKKKENICDAIILGIFLWCHLINLFMFLKAHFGHICRMMPFILTLNFLIWEWLEAAKLNASWY